MKKINWTFGLIVMLTTIFGLAFATQESRAEYPTKPVSFLIPFGVGGSADLMGRALANGAKDTLGQPIVPINRPGAGGGIMYTALNASKADGYSVGWNSTSILTTTNIGNVPFKYTDFENICRIGYTAMPIAVRKDAPWNTLQELVDYAKKNPGKIKIGNAGTGSGTHLTAVMLAEVTDIQVVHVPLGAKRRVPSCLGGEVQVICVPLPEAAPQCQAGQMRLLAVSTANRDPKFPEVPSMKELGYPVVMDLFRGISVPKGTPKSVIQKLVAAFEKGSQDEDFKKIADKKGFNISFQGNEAFEAYLKEQNENVIESLKLGGLIK
jgi:tripartite-type tricarboxylate transporter receptor subunit TctC